MGGLRDEVPGVKWNRVLCVNPPVACLNCWGWELMVNSQAEAGWEGVRVHWILISNLWPDPMLLLFSC